MTDQEKLHDERLETLAHVNKQLREIKRFDPVKLTCGCGRRMLLHRATRCLYCGVFFCQQCAEIHFGQTIKERNIRRG